MTWENLLFVVVSGKRKSGKDYFSDLLRKELCSLGFSVPIIHLSEPIKRTFAENFNLDLDLLMSASEYKESFRSQMVRWSEQQRDLDPNIFCRQALESEYSFPSRPPSPALLIIADARRPSDLAFFSRFSNGDNLLHFRMLATDQVRRHRGWVFTPGIDDAETECALDSSKFDILINNDSEDCLRASLRDTVTLISSRLSAMVSKL